MLSALESCHTPRSVMLEAGLVARLIINGAFDSVIFGCLGSTEHPVPQQNNVFLSTSERENQRAQSPSVLATLHTRLPILDYLQEKNGSVQIIRQRRSQPLSAEVGTNHVGHRRFLSTTRPSHHCHRLTSTNTTNHTPRERTESTIHWSLLECAAPGRSSQCGTRGFPGLTANPQHIRGPSWSVRLLDCNALRFPPAVCGTLPHTEAFGVNNEDATV